VTPHNTNYKTPPEGGFLLSFGFCVFCGSPTPFAVFFEFQLSLKGLFILSGNIIYSLADRTS
jgi:hypothetical protein